MRPLVKEYFDNRAKTFDSIYIDESRWSHWLNTTFRRAIYERFDIALQASGDVSGKSILDVGCGSGRYLVEYAERGAGRVVGIDLSKEMLELARRLQNGLGVEDRCELVEGDFLQFQENERFDIVLAMGFFDYVAEPLTVLKKMSDLARDKVMASFPGKSLFRMHLRRFRYRLRNCPVFFYTAHEVEELAYRSGLQSYEVVPVPSRAGFVLLADKHA